MPTHGTNEKMSGERNIFDLLKQDHEKVRYLFDRIAKSGKKATSSHEKLFTELKEELETHMEGEERIFYPPLEKHAEMSEKTLEAFEEHLVAKSLLGTFKNLPVDDKRWSAKVQVLNELVEHHLKEEENELFKLARKALDRNQTQDMAVEFMRHKRMRKP